MKMYYTFGTEPYFPYGEGEYIVVEAPTPELCHALFRSKHPDRCESSLNCADYYPEHEFEENIRDKWFKDVDPSEYLTVVDRVSEYDHIYYQVMEERLTEDAECKVNEYRQVHYNPDGLETLTCLEGLGSEDYRNLARSFIAHRRNDVADDLTWESVIEDYFHIL